MLHLQLHLKNNIGIINQPCSDKNPQVTGTGGGISIRDGKHIFIAPSGVQKELMKPEDIFVMHAESHVYLRRPEVQYIYSLVIWSTI